FLFSVFLCFFWGFVFFFLGFYGSFGFFFLFWGFFFGAGGGGGGVAARLRDFHHESSEFAEVSEIHTVRTAIDDVTADR
uniref:hypothetical protein n=1 Tax=Nocardia abscessus TaxID=120957 RepID=UPI0024577DBB